MPDAEVGTPYEFQFTGEAGCLPYHFKYKAGRVPGLEITDSGLITGTPTAEGAFTFWVELTDSTTCNTTPSQAQFTLFVARRVVITSTKLPAAKIGVSYSSAITADGGGSLTWSVVNGSLPPGLSLNPNDGSLSGVPTAVGTFYFTVMVGDDKRRRTQDYAFTVANPLAVAPVVLPVAEVGVPLRAQLAASGGIGPLTWAGRLPAGLKLDPQGVAQGTPAASGRFSVPVTITDSDGQVINTTVGLFIAARLAITTTEPARATLGQNFRLRLAARGGVAARVWAIASGKPPPGITLNRNTGVLTGTPRARGSYRIGLKLTDKLKAAATRTLTLTVDA